MVNVQYTKTSDYRAHRFNLKTEIIEIDGKKYARKTIVNKDAEKHLDTIYSNCERLKSIFEPEYKICSAKKDGESILFDYVEGKSFEDMLSDAIAEMDEPVIWNILEAYYNLVYRMSRHKGFTKSPEFEKVFGQFPDDPELETGDFVDVDLIFSNIICGSETYIIDYEWCFDFQIPIKYVFWKGLFTSKSFSTLPDDFIEDVYRKYGISDADRTQFLSMEEHFVDYARGGRLSFAAEASGIRRVSINYDNLKSAIKSYPVVFFAVKEGVAQKVYEGVSYPGINIIDFTINENYDRLEMFVAPVLSIISGIKVTADINGESTIVPFETTSEADYVEPRFFLKNTPVIIVKEKLKHFRLEFDVVIWNSLSLEEKSLNAYLNCIDYVSANARNELDRRYQQLEQTKKELDSNRQQLEKTQIELDSNRQQLEKTQKELDCNYQKLEHTQRELDATYQQLQQTTNDLQVSNNNIDSLNSKLESVETELQSTKNTLQSKEADLQIITTEYNNTMAMLRRKNIFKAFIFFIRVRKSRNDY